MRRVVVTGMGLVSCLGHDKETVIKSLREGKSGISFNETFKEMGLRSHVSGSIEIDLGEHIDRKHLRFMGDAASFAYISLQKAIDDAGLDAEQVSNPRTGLMSSTVSACLATHFGIKGLNYSITSACATSTHCIGAAMEQIQWGKQDVIFAGGGEEEHWSLAMMFDAMGALSSKYNDNPGVASRAYDAARDGFVIAAGGGMLVLEELEHARARGAKIYAEVVGYGATSDGDNMVAPSGEGAIRCMQQAIETVDAPIDYMNTHGTSTPVGDIAELKAMRAVFGDSVPPFSSSKSLCGHSLGAAGVQEAIHCLLMLENGFVAGSANIDELDPQAADFPVLRETKESPDLTTVMSNNFGFGGTNSCLVFKRMA